MQDSGSPTTEQPRGRLSLGQTVYGQIVQRVIDGDYAVGERLPAEDELAKQFHVSRVTIRQALLKLRKYRLVVSLQGSGNYVGCLPPENAGAMMAGLETATFEEAFEFRNCLECAAAALAAENRTDEHLRRMTEAVAQPPVDEASATQWFIRHRLADLEFHEAIAAASGNPIFVNVVQALSPTFSTRWLPWYGERNEPCERRATTIMDEHRVILNAVSSGDAEMARVAMQSHLKRARRRMLDRMSVTAKAGPTGT